jgi:hypothetical protein
LTTQAPPSEARAPEAREPSLLAAGRAALRRFWRPFLLIQATAVLLVVAYRASASVRAACDVAAAVKARGGLPFAALTGALAGAWLPELAKWLTDRQARQPRGRAATIAFHTIFFAVNGAVVDLLYRFESVLFGAQNAPDTVAAKVAFDQFVFSPLWLSLIVALFAWRKYDYGVARTWAVLRNGFVRRRVMPLLLPNWCFWIPLVSIIYALPASLQFLLFVLVLAAWSLIMVFIASQDAEDAVSTSAAPSQPQS